MYSKKIYIFFIILTSFLITSCGGGNKSSDFNPQGTKVRDVEVKTAESLKYAGQVPQGIEFLNFSDAKGISISVTKPNNIDADEISIKENSFLEKYPDYNFESNKFITISFPKKTNSRQLVIAKIDKQIDGVLVKDFENNFLTHAAFIQADNLVKFYVVPHQGNVTFALVTNQ